MSRRVSLDEDAIAALQELSERYRTSDLSKIVIALAAESRTLLAICQRPATAEQPKAIAPQSDTDPDLLALSALLE